MVEFSNIFGVGDGSKPASLPRHWPYPTEEDLRDRPKRIININKEQDYSFCNNFVKTSKYEVHTFLPKYLMEEFNPKTKFANCYFLIIAVLQCITAISNTAGIPTVLMPLLFVVFVDGIFQIVEDRARHKADKEANASEALKYDADEFSFVPVKWHEVAVGDFIKINNRDTIPADCIIMAVSEKREPAQGQCYVETKSLDGETNLKLRRALASTMTHIKNADQIPEIRGKIEMEHPNNVIASFTGVVDLASMGRDGVMPKNLLLRGCVLRNTEWVIGLVVNTGHDTKIMMSASATKAKSSLLENMASNEIRRIIMVLCLVCAAGATGQTLWNDSFDVANIPYLAWEPSPAGNWFVAFFYFFLLHATFIPVSLYVSMTVVRFFQAWFMNQDLEMYYDHTDTPSAVRTMTLNEELGQISHIFSDKTGTLTCNIMDFRKFSVNGASYGQGITEIGKAAWKLQGKEVPADVLEGERMAQTHAVDHVAFYDPALARDLTNEKQRVCIERFLRILALCHDSIPENVGGVIKISASNPDDDALVCAATHLGFQFTDRREKVALLHNKAADIMEEHTVLETIGFSSKRKRLSVFVKDSAGKYWVYMKGADTVMWDRLLPGQAALIAKTAEHLDQYGTEGLRCLVVGYAEIGAEKFAKWHEVYRSASTDMAQLDKQKKGEPNDIDALQDQIETGLLCAGCTGIEDRLQDGVPETIASLAKAGINIWVLTGDKEETAVNIAVACNLVHPDPYMVKVVLNKRTTGSKEAIKTAFRRAGDEFDLNATVPRALIVDGPVLIMTLADPELRDALLLFSIRCKAVVCCRVSPDQKREIVNLVKMNVPDVRTLAIGDGANDVAMIQTAHIGVGIQGEEGLQAVNSSDYAIAQFRFLGPLLLHHGRYNYVRMCSLVCYMFYKNFMMSMAQWWFNFSCGFSGQKYYIEVGIQFFNLFFTGLPIVLHAIYDKDLILYLDQFPQLYQSGIKSEYFNPSVFWTWMLHGLGESILMGIMPVALLTNSDPEFGLFATHWEAGALCLTAIIIICNVKMCFIQQRWYPLSILIVVLSVASWFGVAALDNVILVVDFDFHGVFSKLMGNPTYWLSLVLMVTMVTAKDIYLSAAARNFNPTNLHVLQAVRFGRYCCFLFSVYCLLTCMCCCRCRGS